jgi:hydroxymethylpyrimidine kinase/phosphomethylpyrimidine kinase
VQASQIRSSDELAAAAPIAVLLVGGLDPGGGAGLVRDVLTAAALGARPLVVGTAWTEQGAGVHRVEARDAGALFDSLRQALTSNPAAVKIGMIPGPDSAAAIVEGLRAFAGPVVVDPVLASSRGGALFRGAPAELLPLLRRATLVTPNAAEAEALSGLPVTGLDEASAAARALVAAGLAAVLVKGGHLGDAALPVTDTRLAGASALVTDTLVAGAELHRLSHPRVGSGDVRGTGCALATALAVHLGRGAPLLEATRAATEWLTRALAAAVDVGGERHLG